jgi:hypothetical protein
MTDDAFFVLDESTQGCRVEIRYLSDPDRLDFY